ncbi:hypothetical protein SPAB_00697 [Salmonella enterica subsp. enterica serovar Paratyphi B str. SPB7]|uniref:Uncharacterized protein n=1 Tax=Salmonella paratyphi B (strain ATCC BAA-1250 / SPB7) TaxID=1016998 RepID=A0A6C6YY66_SALPB|nr:hypothetical protein SPAB_00697 [Salmonella enterica subsp. enterica serovar Paratyphi B str. SPB7]
MKVTNMMSCIIICKNIIVSGRYIKSGIDLILLLFT